MPKILRNHQLIFKEYFGQVGQMTKFCSASNSSPFLFCRNCSPYWIFHHSSAVRLAWSRWRSSPHTQLRCLTALIHISDYKLHRLPFLFARWVTSLPYLIVALPWKDMDTIAWSPVHLKCQWPPEVPFFLLRPLVGCGNSHSLHPKRDYSADLNLAPSHPSFRRRTNSYWPWIASSQLIKCISPSVSGRPISPLYLRDRLTSAQKLPRNEADKEELLWPFSRAHFFLPLLPLGLVKLVWAAYQEPREPHQSAWISSVVFGVCRVAVRRLLPPPTRSDHLHAYGGAPQQQATHILALSEPLLGVKIW